MKNFFKFLWSMLEEMARIRAAAHFSRMKNYDAAREILSK